MPRSDDGFAELLDADQLRRYRHALHDGAGRLARRTLWHINSAAEGGGVAELLRSCLGYLRNGAIDTRWLVFQGDRPFFDITKRIHNRLHGDPGDGGPLGARERRHLDAVAARNVDVLRGYVRPGDVAVVHDPQPIGLIDALAELGATVIWTCHVGADRPNDLVRSTWAFLRPSLAGASVVTFTRAAYVWEGLEAIPVALIPPCIDPLSLKNVELEVSRRDAILHAARVVEPSLRGTPSFVRTDGAPGLVTHRAEMFEEEAVPADVPLLVQVSRWDRLKDPLGVLRGFAHTGGIDEAHLLLAGPTPDAVADDPEAEHVLTEVRDAWDGLGRGIRERVHLACLPTEDVEENAVIVNALQRRADVVVQKSLAEGFGLTVTEAMWKARPVVAGRVGGIRDQIDDGANGLLVDPRDMGAFEVAVGSLLRDRERARGMAAAARERVRERYLPPQYLGGYLDLIERLLR